MDESLVRNASIISAALLARKVAGIGGLENVTQAVLDEIARLAVAMVKAIDTAAAPAV